MDTKSKSYLLFGLFLLLVGVVVLADTVDKNIATLNFAEDISSLYNFSINSTDVGAEQNITWVNITIPSSFSFTLNTNFTNAGVHTFSNTSTVLSFFNISGLIMNTTYNFVFNATASNPGVFNITINTYNQTASTNTTNFTITINDTAIPSNVSFVSPTPASGSSLSISQILANVSIIDNGVIGTIRVYLFNSTGLVNNTNSTSNPAFVNFTGLSDGTYYVNATANDSAGNQNLTGTSTRTIIVDTAIPSNVSFVSPTPSAYNNQSLSEIYVNISVTDATSGVNTIRVYLFNSTGLVNNTNSTSNPAFVNFTGLSDGTYYVNATANDSAGNQNLTGTGTRTIIVDITAPLLALSENTVTSSSITLNAVLSDTTSGINGTCSSNRGTVTGTGGSQTLAESSLACGSAFTYTVTCTDYAGNSVVKSLSPSTLGCGGSSGGGSGGSSSTTSNGSSWTSTTIVSSDSLTNGYSSMLGKNQRLKLAIINETHYVGVTFVSNFSVDIEVSSSVQKTSISPGEVRKFDLNSDGFYDLSITLNSVVDGKAYLLVNSIHESVSNPSNNAPSGSNSNSGQTAGNVGSDADTKTSTSLKLSMKSWIIIVIVLVIIIVIVALVMKNKKKSATKKVHYRNK